MVALLTMKLLIVYLPDNDTKINMEYYSARDKCSFQAYEL